MIRGSTAKNTGFVFLNVHFYYRICEAIGGEKEMEHLNLLFCQQFLITKVMDIFHQGMTNQILYLLTYRDRETSKLVFQLLLDEAFYHN